MNREEIVKDIKSRYLILEKNGKEIELNINNKEEMFKKLEDQEDQNLKHYINAEELKIVSNKEAPSIKVMQEQELIGYVPSSDSGHFQLFPKGKVLFNLIKEWCDDIAIKDLNCLEIDSPILYDWSDLEIQEQAKSFHERHYIVKVPNDEKKEFVLRFAGDFGLFKMLKSANVNYKQLPIRIYEFSKSFRFEKKGELSGLKRLRAFHMPDIHSFSKDSKSAKEEFLLLHNKFDKLLNGLEIDFAIVFRVVEKYYDEYKPMILEISKISKKPVFIELLSDMKHYWAIKNEYQFIDSVYGNVQLSTIQLDIKDSKVYGLNYIDQNGKKEGYVICHSSIGSIERLIYSILEQSLKQKHPVLPLWVSPIQLRVIPVSLNHLEFCKNLKFNEGIRWDIDDSDNRLSKKIINARKEWIPYVLVIGDQEINSGNFSVSIRKNESKIILGKDQLEKEILEQVKGFPKIRQSLLREKSRSPIFYG
jgi:threonyl-tRNA synthetase